jgi:hypothetical protein
MFLRSVKDKSTHKQRQWSQRFHSGKDVTLLLFWFSAPCKLVSKEDTALIFRAAAYLHVKQALQRRRPTQTSSYSLAMFESINPCKAPVLKMSSRCTPELSNKRF